MQSGVRSPETVCTPPTSSMHFRVLSLYLLLFRLLFRSISVWGQIRISAPIEGEVSRRAHVRGGVR